MTRVTVDRSAPTGVSAGGQSHARERRCRWVRAVLGLLAAGLIVGCGNGGKATTPPQGGSPTPTRAAMSPDQRALGPGEAAMRGAAVDFIGAALGGDVERARSFLTPALNGRTADPHRALGVAERPETFGIAASSVTGDQGQVDAALRYPNRTVAVALRMEQVADHWLIADIVPSS